MKQLFNLKSIIRLALVTLCFLTVGVGNIWGWNLADGRKVYFNMQNQTDFGTPYFRIGRHEGGDWSAATEMTTVPGTKYLFVYTQSGTWSNYGAFSVANGKGFTDENNIFQPWSGQPSSEGYSGDVVISKQIFFQKYDATSDCYLEIKSANGSESNGCQYYDVNAQTSDDGGSLVTDIPMYSVTFANAQSHGTISVQKYTKTDGSTKESISTGDEVYPTQIIEITATPDANYALAGSLVVTGATLISGTTYYVTGNCVITATFEPRWNIKGSMDDGWSAYHPMNFVSGNAFSGKITLKADTAYSLKVFDRLTAGDTRYFGCSTRDHDYTYVGQSEAVSLQATGNSLMLMTTSAGEYTFRWDSTAKTLQIDYPDAPIKHPNMNYVYMEKYTDWTGGGTYCYTHYWYTKDATDHPLTTWNNNDPKMTGYTTYKKEEIGNDATGNKDFFTIPALSAYPKIIVKDNVGDGSHTTPMAASALVTTGHEGHYLYWADKDNCTWHTIQVHISLDDMGATEHGTTWRNVTFNDTTMKDVDCPTKTYYDFGGYYTQKEGTGTQIIDAEGHWNTDIEDYTSSGKWVHSGDTTKLYAKWTEKSFTVTLNAGDHGTVNSGSGEVSTSTTVTGHPITSSSTFTVTAADGYAFERWTLAPSGVAVITETASSGATKTFTITTSAAVTITPNYYARYGLYGSLDDKDNTKAGMPGWPSDPASGSTYSEGTYTFSLSLTKPNAIYKFRILDRRDNTSWGLASKTVVSEKTNTIFNSTADDAQLATAGKGTYTITVTEDVDGESVTHPKVYIENPTSYLVTLGHKSVILEGDEGTLGTIIAKDAANNEYTSGQYIASGETVTIVTTCPDDYQLAGLWNSSAYSGYPLGFSSWVVGEAVKAYAKFTEKSNTFSASSDNNWSTTGNWSGGAVPTTNEVAILQAPVNVDIAHAVAKRVIIDQNSHTGKLTIQPNNGLELTGTIKKTTDGSTYSAPTPADLVLESSSAGNASLIFDNSNTAQATVQMYSKANIVIEPSEQWNWQFMGIPFTTTKANPSYYGSYLYEWKSTGVWDEVANGGTMNAFTGYCITQDAATTYVMSGTLTPTTSHAWTIPAEKEFVMANSWTAPIYVGAITDDALAVEKKNIYLFNTGHSSESAAGKASERYEAGTYLTLPIHSAPYTGDSLIAPMQGFYVDNTGGSAGTVTLDYATVVRPTGTRNDIVAGPMHAPKRTQEQQVDNRPTVLKMWANGAKYNDRVVLLERTDFSTGFDNGWDGKKLNFGEVGPSVYVINTLGEPDAVSAVPDLEGTVVGFRAGTNNTCTMTFEYDGEKTFFLNDLQEQQSARIDNETSYTFATNATDNEARFVISQTPIAKTPTDIEPVTDNRSPLTVTKMLINGHIYIIRNGQVYGADGMLIK